MKSSPIAIRQQQHSLFINIRWRNNIPAGSGSIVHPQECLSKRSCLVQSKIFFFLNLNERFESRLLLIYGDDTFICIHCTDKFDVFPRYKKERNASSSDTRNILFKKEASIAANRNWQPSVRNRPHANDVTKSFVFRLEKQSRNVSSTNVTPSIKTLTVIDLNCTSCT